MNFLNKLLLFVIFTISNSACYADLCDKGIDPSTDEGWLVSNMCYFDNTALVKVHKGYLRGKFNPINYFRDTGTYIYNVEILKIYTGKAPKSISCLVSFREGNISYSTTHLTGNKFISFNDYDDECMYLDIAVYPEQNSALKKLAQSIVEHLLTNQAQEDERNN